MEMFSLNGVFYKNRDENGRSAFLMEDFKPTPQRGTEILNQYYEGVVVSG